jgi:CHAT domain-containing protein
MTRRSDNDMNAGYDRALTLSERYEGSGDLQDLNAAIEAWRELAHELGFAESALPVQVGVESNLAIYLVQRYFAVGKREDLDAALTGWEEALAKVSSDSPEGLMILSNLGAGLRVRYSQTSELADLQKMIRVFEQVLAATPSDDQEWPGRLSNLAVGLMDRYERTGALGDIREAVSAYERVVAATPLGHPERPGFLSNLARANLLYYSATGGPESLTRSIDVYEQAVAAAPAHHPERPEYFNGLGTALEFRYERSGNADDLQRTIEAAERALASVSASSPSRASFLNNLGNGLRLRYYRTGDLDDLDRAIQAYENAATESPPPAPDRPAYIQNIGIALQDRYARTGNEGDLERSIRAHEEAVRRSPPDAPERRGRLVNLANGLLDHYERSGRRSELNRAAALAEQAVATGTTDPPTPAKFLNTLGSARWRLYARNGNADDIQAAITAFQRAVADLSPDSPEGPVYLNNLAVALSHRDAEVGDKDAAGAFREACRTGMEVRPEWALLAARSWGTWADTRQEWREAAEAYRFGLIALDRLFRAQLNREHKEQWLVEAQALPARAAYAMAKTDDPRSAVVALEQGRALLLSDRLERDRIDLERLAGQGHRDLAGRYRSLTDQLSALEHGGLEQDESRNANLQGTGATRKDALRTVWRDLEEVINQIRRVPGYEHFLAPMTFTEVTAAAEVVPIVYVAAAEAGGLGLLIGAGASVTTIWLPELTEEKLRNKATGLLDADKSSQRDPAGWQAELESVSGWLWKAVIGPVLDTLGAADRAVLVPAGLLGLLPLHAAWTEDRSYPTGRRYALDQVQLTYAPNARACLVARDMAGRVASGGVLVIDDPWGAAGTALPLAGAEAAEVLARFDRGLRLSGGQATRHAVLAEMSGWPVLHFACHGFANPGEPLDSALALADDEVLTLRDIFGMRLRGTRLAVLSACETAVPGVALPEEAVGLPVGFLQAGVPGVVGSLWSVADASTAVLMGRFYQLWRQDGLHPAEALRRAQRWLRDATNAEKQAAFPNIPALTAPQGSAAVRAFWENARSHEHPYYWAAFTYTGA